MCIPRTTVHRYLPVTTLLPLLATIMLPTPHGSLDACTATAQLIHLRTRILCERGHAIIRCMLSDQSLVDGLGAAFQMLKIQGEPPAEILVMLNDGPGSHVHKHLFKYRAL